MFLSVIHLLLKLSIKNLVFLWVSLNGAKVIKRADSIYYYLNNYQRGYFSGVRYAFFHKNDTVTFNTNYEGREIKILIY